MISLGFGILGDFGFISLSGLAGDFIVGSDWSAGDTGTIWFPWMFGTLWSISLFEFAGVVPPGEEGVIKYNPWEPGTEKPRIL